MEVESNNCENNYSNEDQVSTKCDGNNKHKENEVFELIHKDGGGILKFNAGMYELFRNSTESYFASSQIRINCKKNYCT
jgi:hypothetical protein